MKMLTTQMTGLLQRISNQNEELIEETARLVAQATVGEGKVLFATFGEMQAVEAAALLSEDAFQNGFAYQPPMTIHSADRIWIITNSAFDPEALALAERLANDFIPFAAIAAEKDHEDNPLSQLAYTYLSTGVTRGLLPGENGERFVFPHAIAALFLYEAVKISYDEMILGE